MNKWDRAFSGVTPVHQAPDTHDAGGAGRQNGVRSAWSFRALYLLGHVHFQRGQFNEAERLLKASINLNPRSVEALYTRGRALRRLSRDAEALACFDAALAIEPRAAEVLAHRGVTLLALDRAADALASFDGALTRNPRLGEVWHSRGNLLLAINRAEEALASHDKALNLARNVPEWWCNRGRALVALERLEEAVQSYTRALAINPRDAGTWSLRAETLFRLARYDHAAEDFARARACDPAFPYASGNLLFSKFSACDWTALEMERTDMLARLRAGERSLTRFQGAAILTSPEDQRICSEIWTTSIAAPARKPLWRGEICRHERIRVAYVCPDFPAHAALAGVIGHHDAERFEIIAVCLDGNRESTVQASTEGTIGRVMNVRGKSDEDIAGLLKDMEADIVIDVQGHSGDARPGIFALRPSPVQVSYLGAGTSGAPWIDYIMADETTVPFGYEKFYTEKVAWLPDTHLAAGAPRDMSGAAPSRAECTLPKTGVVFCCFGDSYKIMPDMFTLWMRLLSAVEGSVLWLLQDNAIAARNLKREAEARGISGERLVFAPRVHGDLHLSRLRLASLFLDTSPFGAGDSATDALCAGVPVLTCMGSTFAGRATASMLRAAGLPEMIAPSVEAYTQLALRFARDADALAALKLKLARNRRSCALFDIKRFARHLEAAYVQIWERCRRGEQPANFRVPPAPF